MSSQNILLDSDIRDWVVLPLFVIMVSAGLLRVHVGMLLRPDPKNQERIEQRTQSSVRATSALKTGAIHFLSTSKLESRKLAYPEILKDQADWCEMYMEQREREKEENPMDDDDDMPNPLAAMDGMKGGMVGMVQNMVMMQGIQFFFSGFILLKVPFSLTMGFKQMFQRGLDGLANLDTSYVSSISLYFLFMYGLRAFFRLVIGTPALETQETQKMWMKLGKKAGPSNPNAPKEDAHIKALNTEADNLEMILPKQFKSNLDQVEKRLLKNKYPKKKAKLGKDDFLLHKTTGKKSKKN
uniref:ER membrane protein complex subunit 3 n=1 Tax=Pseudo-nitzschia australis TaxID=44445 RepID=A0A7S4ALZ1_9STRA|mmetsp:Transcript_22147/g.48195  ORF Transcript_22147/g.48195 Transcript_22147/m.48195 type:complete len:297 (+) Transcript_22147:283-1173(+)